MITARIADLPGAHSNLNVDIVSALFADPPTTMPRRGNAWDRLVDASIGDNRRKVRDVLLGRVGARQGTGRAQAIDVTALLPAITAFKRTWKLSSLPPEAPKEYRRLHTEITSRLDEAMSDELARLQAWHDRVTSWLPSDAQASDLADEFAHAAGVALAAGIFAPQRLKEPFDETIRQFRRTKFSTIREVGDLLASRDDQRDGRLLSALALDRQKPIVEIERFVDQTMEIATNTSQRAQQQLETFQHDGSENLIDPLKTQLRQLRAALEGSTP
jgi:hypothetical protein